MATIALSGTQTIIQSNKDDDCKPVPKPEPPKPEPECCGKTYHIELHFH